MAANSAAHSFASFREFYPYYLGEHSNVICRRLHFVGSSLAVLLVMAAIITGRNWLFGAAVVSAYGLAWIGHFVFEHNRPATFKHPLYSLIGDFAMARDILVGRIRW